MSDSKISLTRERKYRNSNTIVIVCKIIENSFVRVPLTKNTLESSVVLSVDPNAPIECHEQFNRGIPSYSLTEYKESVSFDYVLTIKSKVNPFSDWTQRYPTTVWIRLATRISSLIIRRDCCSVYTRLRFKRNSIIFVM